MRKQDKCRCGNSKGVDSTQCRDCHYNRGSDTEQIFARIRMNTVMPDGVDGCWLSTYSPFDLYGHRRVKVNRKSYFVHRLAHQVFNVDDPLTPERPQVNHRCGNGACWNPAHLYAGTQAENMHDALNHGTIPTAQCGTTSGYQKHRSNGEEACDDCKKALRQYSERRRRRDGAAVFRPAQCGTSSGYNAHRKRNEEPCEKCRSANSEYLKEYRRKKSA